MTHRTDLQGSTGILPGPRTLKDSEPRSYKIPQIALWLITVVILTTLCTQVYCRAFPDTIVGECRVISLKGECTLYMINTVYFSEIDCSTLVNELTLSGHYICNYTEETLGIGHYKSDMALAFMFAVCILIMVLYSGIHLYILN